VEEIPKPVMIHLDNDGCICTYNVQVLGNTIQVGYTFSLNRIFYNNDEYPALRQLWGTVVNKNTELLVLIKMTSQPTKTEEKQTSQL
jgi:predicted membrane chloride channel (bestrophin family)